ncbi:response regulator [Mesorhizobium sp.]|uniref:response regulator transcription factor n=1 Tax=Mesorhizobium sp. TaxID=1871066 RepID=UPI00257C5687|nr:response regulator [Mesorhizobium sp.]
MPEMAILLFALAQIPGQDDVSREFLIAVVDDDESFRMALVDSLSSLGYGACGFASAEDFIAWEAGASYSCVIADIHMPGMSGLDLARLLTGRRRGVPVVMVTARSNLGIVDQAAANGATCLLRKPFKTEALIDCIEKALKV